MKSQLLRMAGDHQEEMKEKNLEIKQLEKKIEELNKKIDFQDKKNKKILTLKAKVSALQ